MNLISLAGIVVSVIAFILVMRRARRNDRLAAMPESALRAESYFEAANGRFPNQYSRELESRGL